MGESAGACMWPDLVPKENVERWLKYLRNEYPTVAFKASTQTQRTHIGQASVSFEHASDSALGTSECIGMVYTCVVYM